MINGEHKRTPLHILKLSYNTVLYPLQTVIISIPDGAAIVTG